MSTKRLLRRQLPLVLFLAVLSGASPALAGPYAGAAMGEGWTMGLDVRLPFSLHVGGAVGAGVGPLGSDAALPFLLAGSLELQYSDFLGMGVVLGWQTLPNVPRDAGTAATTLRARIRIRLPLVPGSALQRPLVPLVAFALDGGSGWLSDSPPDADAGVSTFGASVGLNMVVLGRVTPFVSLGYRQHLLPGPDLRQFEGHLGVSVRLFGDSLLGPPPAREREPRSERGPRDTRELCEGLPPAVLPARLCSWPSVMPPYPL